MNYIEFTVKNESQQREIFKDEISTKVKKELK